LGNANIDDSCRLRTDRTSLKASLLRVGMHNTCGSSAAERKLLCHLATHGRFGDVSPWAPHRLGDKPSNQNTDALDLPKRLIFKRK